MGNVLYRYMQLRCLRINEIYGYGYIGTSFIIHVYVYTRYQYRHLRWLWPLLNFESLWLLRYLIILALSSPETCVPPQYLRSIYWNSHYDTNLKKEKNEVAKVIFEWGYFSHFTKIQLNRKMKPKQRSYVVYVINRTCNIL